MSRTRRFLSGLGVGYASQFLLALVGLWMTRFLLHRLGQQDYGLWLVATQLLAYLMLTDLGIVALLPREVAYATGRAGGDGGPSLPVVVGQTARIVFWQLPLVALTAVILWLFLPAEWQPLSRPLGVGILAFVLTFPLRLLPQTLRGLQDLAFLGGLQTFSLLAGTAVTVLLVLAGTGLYALAAGWAVTQIVVSVGSFVRLKMRFPEALPTSWPRVTAEAARYRFSRGAWVSISQIAVVLLNGTDVVIIGKMLGAAAVVPYTCTAKLIAFLTNQPQLLMQTAEPGLSEMRTGGSPASILRVATALTQGILIFSGAIVCVVLLINHGFVRIWVGEAQWGGLTLTGLLLTRMLLGHWELTSASAIFAFGYERRLALVGLANGVLTVVASILLVRLLGIKGAPLGSLIGITALSLPANLFALSRVTNVRVPQLLLAQWPWAWRFLVVLAVCWIVAVVWRPSSLLALGVAATAVGLVYSLLMLQRVLRPPLSIYLHPKIAAALRRLPRFLHGSSPIETNPA